MLSVIKQSQKHSSMFKLKLDAKLTWSTKVSILQPFSCHIVHLCRSLVPHWPSSETGPLKTDSRDHNLFEIFHSLEST